MNPNIAANQQRLFLEFLAQLRPHFGRDSALPRRITDLLNRNRALGSRDRKLYRELVYTTLRFLPWVDRLLDTDVATAAKIIAWLAPELKPTSLYRSAHGGDWPAVPDSLADKAALLTTLVAEANPTGRVNPPGESRAECGEGNSIRTAAHPAGSPYPFNPESLLPAWFREHCPAAFTEPHLSALNSRASIWVRLQVNDRSLVLNEFAAQHWPVESPTDFPDALCLPPNADVAGTDAYRRGFIEIQDLGSQLVLAHADIAPGAHWLDACAGAGGKTLQLARLVGDAGHVDATDIRPDVLEELRDRAARARLTNIAIGQTPTGLYDGVLVDAPCSGSGTWRRQPHLKWYLQPETIPSFNRTQLAILAANAPLVRPGGELIYATCSLSRFENHDLVATFLATHPQFSAMKPTRDHGGDLSAAGGHPNSKKDCPQQTAGGGFPFDGLGTMLLPGTLNTDGFYVAVLRRDE